jgi:hypothetical protein
MIPSIVQPKRPAGPGWARAAWWRAPAALAARGYPVEAWEHAASGMFVLSAVEVPTPEPGEVSVGPEYHLSMSYGGHRCSSGDAVWALREFDLAEAKEDNHVPSGRVRNFWRPVADPLAGYECPCVDAEPAMREDKGDFVWRGVTR